MHSQLKIIPSDLTLFIVFYSSVFKNPRKPKPKRTKLTHVGVENDHGGSETFVQSFTGSEGRVLLQLILS